MKKKMLMAGLAVVALAVASGAATAQVSPTSPPTARIARADADQDGRISRAEFVQGRLARLTSADTDRNGAVTVEERRAARQAMIDQRVSRRFDRLDADKDGAISRSEFDMRAEAAVQRDAPHAGRGPRHHRLDAGRRGAGRTGTGRMGAAPVVIADVQARVATNFDRLDADHDGFLTVAERRASRANLRHRLHDRRAQRMARRHGERWMDRPMTAPPSPPSLASE